MTSFPRGFSVDGQPRAFAMVPTTDTCSGWRTDRSSQLALVLADRRIRSRSGARRRPRTCRCAGRMIVVRSGAARRTRTIRILGAPRHLFEVDRLKRRSTLPRPFPAHRLGVRQHIDSDLPPSSPAGRAAGFATRRTNISTLMPVSFSNTSAIFCPARSGSRSPRPALPSAFALATSTASCARPRGLRRR